MVITVDPPVTGTAPGKKPAGKEAEDLPTDGSVPETETETESGVGVGWATVHPLHRPDPTSTTNSSVTGSDVTSSDDGKDGLMTAISTSASASSSSVGVSGASMGSGETLDPGSAHHFCEQMRGLTERMFTELEQSVASLSSAGVSGAPITLLGQMQEHAALFRDSASSAQSHFARHLSTQDQVLADDSLAATVSGTYIGTRT
ncbi:hypothetical protein DMP14_31455 [Pseudonocardia sp. Ae707_Ps2]